MPTVLGPNFEVFANYKQVEIAQSLNFEEKNYMIDLLKTVYKDMSPEQRQDIRLLVDLLRKKSLMKKAIILLPL